MNPADARVYALVCAHPGLTAREYAERLGEPVGRLGLRCVTLRRAGYLRHDGVRIKCRWFPNTGPLPQYLLDLIQTVRANPGSTTRACMGFMGVSLEEAAFRLRSLHERGLLHRVPVHNNQGRPSYRWYHPDAPNIPTAPAPCPVTVAELRAYRRIAGFGVKEVARALGVSIPWVVAVENGRIPLRPGAAQRLLALYAGEPEGVLDRRKQQTEPTFVGLDPEGPDPTQNPEEAVTMGRALDWMDQWDREQRDKRPKWKGSRRAPVPLARAVLEGLTLDELGAKLGRTRERARNLIWRFHRDFQRFYTIDERQEREVEEAQLALLDEQEQRERAEQSVRDREQNLVLTIASVRPIPGVPGVVSHPHVVSWVDRLVRMGLASEYIENAIWTSEGEEMQGSVLRLTAAGQNLFGCPCLLAPPPPSRLLAAYLSTQAHLIPSPTVSK